MFPETSVSLSVKYIIPLYLSVVGPFGHPLLLLAFATLRKSWGKKKKQPVPFFRCFQLAKKETFFLQPISFISPHSVLPGQIISVSSTVTNTRRCHGDERQRKISFSLFVKQLQQKSRGEPSLRHENQEDVMQ